MPHKKKIWVLTLSSLALAMFLSSSAYAQDLPIGLQKLIEYRQELAQSITFFLAFFAGVISFTSPCGIAFIPTFFSVAFKERKRTMLMAVSFTIGMVISFAIFGLIAGLLGDFFNQYKLLLGTISGIVLVIFAMLLFFNVSIGIFNFKLDYSKAKSALSVGILGFFFGVGFTPCAGPILIGILTLAANAQTLMSGVFMLIFYGLGIGVPIIILAYFSDRYDWANSKLLRGKPIEFRLFGKKITTHTYNMIGSILLLIIGLLIFFYQGTFFFQSDLPRYIPWSMSFWAYMNESAVESELLTSFFGNLSGIALVVLLAIFIHYNIRRNGKR